MADADRIPLEPIASSNLKAIGYDLATQRLAVQFLNGTIFYYGAVPPAVANEFGAAASKGTFYTTQIRRKFSSARMTGPCSACKAEGWLLEACGCAAGVFRQAVPKGRDVTCPDCEGTGSRRFRVHPNPEILVASCRTCNGRGAVRTKPR